MQLLDEFHNPPGTHALHVHLGNRERHGPFTTGRARSKHRGGVAALFCDGRVQFIDDTIESSTVALYGTRQRRPILLKPSAAPVWSA